MLKIWDRYEWWLFDQSKRIPKKKFKKLLFSTSFLTMIWTDVGIDYRSHLYINTCTHFELIAYKYHNSSIQCWISQSKYSYGNFWVKNGWNEENYLKIWLFTWFFLFFFCVKMSTYNIYYSSIVLNALKNNERGNVVAFEASFPSEIDYIDWMSELIFTHREFGTLKVCSHHFNGFTNIIKCFGQ